MKFSNWLQNELNKRDWLQSDLVRNAKNAGYPISSMQISRIINQERKAGPDSCISIAHALNIPRETVFKVRGWLLTKPEEIIPVGTSPKAAQVIRLLSRLPLGEQEAVSEAFESQLKAMERVSQLRGSQRLQAPVRPSLDQIQAELEEEFRTLLPDAYERVLKKLASEEAAAQLGQVSVAA